MKISSLQNEKIKNILKLKKSRERKKRDLIIIEGRKEIELALSSGMEIVDFFYCSKFNKLNNPFKINKFIELGENVFKKISYRDAPDGFLALAKPKYLNKNQIKLKNNPLIVILESLEKPGNLGAILRTCDALKVDLVIMNDLKTDLYNPNIIRSSRGTIFTVPVISIEYDSTIAFLKKHKIKIFVTALLAKKNYLEVNYKFSSAIVLGSEDKGLSKQWLESADELIKIPMKGEIDSLNVSVSAAVILFEAERQRLSY